MLLNVVMSKIHFNKNTSITKYMSVIGAYKV